ncbi:hypothetical protein EV702DRAFT_1203370 [Suillus placidus]|uniref:Ribonuclease H1 N-terminal domain-containing protein n=1 Tax=Suillus placidus TaxID=48579 RepID=A0A9P6ZJ06_9AGAM|nr:hypothetical protein EV702DRAFT_1203370 [Suillus placidus]
MTSTSMIDAVPAAPIAGGNGADNLAALLAQMNITGQDASEVTSAIHDIVQNAVVAAVSAISDFSTTVVSDPLTPAPTSVPAPTTAPSALLTPALTSVPAPAPVATVNVLPVSAPVPLVVEPTPGAVDFTQTPVEVTYNIPVLDATGPFYWVTRGRRIGIFSTWQQTSSHVIGVSRASFSKVLSVAEGVQLMEQAIDCGETEVLP